MRKKNAPEKRIFILNDMKEQRKEAIEAAKNHKDIKPIKYDLKR
jgi:hypothetical protein